MWNTKNHRYLFAVVLVGLILSGLSPGCTDQLLDKSPRGELTQAQFFQTEEHALEATNATYNQLRNFNVHSFPWLGLTEIASDDAVKGSVPSDAPFLSEINDFTFTPSNGAFLGTWNAYYEGIFRANTAILNIPNIDMDTDLRNRLVAENKFLRAYYYFFLVRAYGGVPLVTEPADDPSEFQIPKATAQEVYAQIEQDLQEAATVLPLKSQYSSADVGRATKGAARGLLAKVHLFQDEFQEAEQRAQEVIDSGEYALLPNYERIFTPEGENSSESLFEVQAVAVETGTGGTPYSVVQGVRGTPNLGWGFNNPSRDLLNTYESGDPRVEPTILFVHEILPRGPEDVVRDNSGMTDERYNQKSFLPLDNPSGSFNGGNNIRRLRYSDVLLIAAEAAFHNDNLTDAQMYLNMVRQRARGGQSATVGIVPEAVAGLIADTVGIGSLEKRPFVRFAMEGGPAETAGIQSFSWNLVDNNSKIQVTNLDVIEAVDGVAVSSVEEFRNEMKTKTPMQPLQLDILRVTESFNSGSKSTNTQNIQFTVTSQALLPDVTAVGQELLDAIWHERRVELAMEQHRFFDLRRQGRAGEELRDLGIEYEDDKHELYPIPQDELDLNPELTQNPGYSN